MIMNFCSSWPGCCHHLLPYRDLVATFWGTFLRLSEDILIILRHKFCTVCKWDFGYLGNFLTLTKTTFVNMFSNPDVLKMRVRLKPKSVIILNVFPCILDNNKRCRNIEWVASFHFRQKCDSIKKKAILQDL